MKASHGLLVYAKIMLAIFAGLAVFSLLAMARSFYRPLDPTPEKVATFKKLILLNSWILFAAVGGAVWALATRKYYMLIASAILFSFVLPPIVQYVRMSLALKKLPPSGDSRSVR